MMRDSRRLGLVLNLVVLSVMVACLFMSGLLGCAARPRPSCSQVCSQVDPSSAEMDLCLIRCEFRRSH